MKGKTSIANKRNKSVFKKKTNTKSRFLAQKQALSFLNKIKSTEDVTDNEENIRSPITPEIAKEIIKITKKGRIKSLNQVISKTSLSKKDINILIDSFFSVPVYIETPKKEIAEIKKLWNKSTSREKKIILHYNPALTPEDIAHIYYAKITVSKSFFMPTVLAGAAAPAIPLTEEEIWREFWILVRGWLKKRGIVLGGLMAGDGPLPIGDLIALGLGLWMIWELLEMWDRLWEQAQMAANNKRYRKQVEGMIQGAIAGAIVKILTVPPCTPLYHYWKKEARAKLKAALDFAKRHLKGKTLQELIDKINEQLARIPPD